MKKKVNLDNEQEAGEFYKRMENADEASIKGFRMSEKGDHYLVETLVELKETQTFYSARIS